MTFEKFHEKDLFPPYGKIINLFTRSDHLTFTFCPFKCITTQYIILTCNHATFQFSIGLLHCQLYYIDQIIPFQPKQPLNISWHNSWTGSGHLAAACLLGPRWRPCDSSSKWHLSPTKSRGQACGEGHHGWSAGGGV